MHLEGPNRGGLSCESCSVNRPSSMENFFCWWRDLAHPRLSFKFNQGVWHCSQYTSLCTWLQEVCRDSINTRCLPFRMSRVLSTCVNVNPNPHVRQHLSHHLGLLAEMLYFFFVLFAYPTLFRYPWYYAVRGVSRMDWSLSQTHHMRAAGKLGEAVFSAVCTN